MNILILGCSFGVPGNGCSVEHHTDNQLKLLGHQVVNCARSGSSNLESLAIAEKMFAIVDFKIDWVVWFHTELIRDMAFVNNDYTRVSFEVLVNTVYSDYAQFVQNQNAKLEVIGGAAPVHPKLFDFIQPDFSIPSWFNKILNLNLPQIQTLSRLDIIEKMQGVGLERKLEILLQHEEILNALEASVDFPDNYHAGTRPHMELAKELHETFLRN